MKIASAMAWIVLWNDGAQRNGERKMLHVQITNYQAGDTDMPSSWDVTDLRLRGCLCCRGTAANHFLALLIAGIGWQRARPAGEAGKAGTVLGDLCVNSASLPIETHRSKAREKCTIQPGSMSQTTSRQTPLTTLKICDSGWLWSNWVSSSLFWAEISAVTPVSS